MMINKFHFLKNNAGFKRYANNTFWLMGERILRMFVALFVGIWIARYLGPEQFGLLNYAQSFVFLFTAITTLGLDGIVVRELVKDESRRDKLLGTAFGLKLVGAILILPILALAVQLTSNDDYTNLLVFIIASATIFQSFNVIDFYYQSKVLSKYVALANGVSLALSSIIKIALLLNEAPLIAFALMTLFDSTVLAIGLIYYYKKTSHLKLFGWSFEWTIAKSLLKDSWPLILSGVMISIFMKIDQVMLQEMVGSIEVGQYAAASRISEVWYFIPMVLASSLFPAIYNSKQISQKLFVNRLVKFYSLMIWLSIGIAVVVTLLSTWLIETLYGGVYLPSADILVIHIWAAIFVFLGVAHSKYLLSENRQMEQFYRTFLAMILNVISNIILIPKYGGIGAAIGILISQFMANFCYDFIFRSSWHQGILKLRAFLFLFR
jgi:O-antigen/teichoic acid export membrane protein